MFFGISFWCRWFCIFFFIFFSTSKPTTDFAVGDISVTGGTLSSFTAISSTVYTAIFTTSGEGTVTFNVAAGSFTDTAGNNNTAATQFTLTYDLTAPSVPTGLVATSGSAQITLSWSANSESDFAKYYIYGGNYTEPLLNQYFLDFIKLTKKNKANFGIHTNGSQLKILQNKN